MKIQKCLTKIIAPLLVVLIATSFFGVFSAQVAGQTTTVQNNTLVPIPAISSTPPLDAGQTAAAQEKAMNIIENVMSVDLSKYNISLQSSSIMDGVPLANDNRKITSLSYTLTPLDGNGDEDSIIRVSFTVEKDVVTSYLTTPFSSQVITNTKYANQNAAVKGFLERYETCNNIDSSNLILMLDNVDLTKNSTMIKENIELAVSVDSFWGIEQANLRWTYTVNGADYTTLQISVNTWGFVRQVFDTRALYTIGDTSVNISMEQAVDIAIENLPAYSYEMLDGSIVQNFKVNKDATMAKLVVVPVDYELRPYWDVSMYLDEVYPGNVFGITAFVWANTGEIISYSNMATGGTYDTDDTNVSDTKSLPSSPDNTIAIVVTAVALVAVAASAIGLVVKKIHR